MDVTAIIDPRLLLAFVAAVVALMLIPGPNVALIVANSIAHGARYGLLTVAGTSSAMAIQLGLTVYGMTQALHVMGLGFEVIRWCGVAYLLYLGITQWRAPPADLSKTKPEPKSRAAIFRRALLVSLTNPKTLFFYSAFFPQFIDKTRAPTGQLAVLCLTFLFVAWTVDSGWVFLAARARGMLARRGRLRNRLSGAFLMGAGLGLAAVRVK